MTTIRSRLDAFIEQLREDAKCSSGNKPCGKICLPQGKSCAGETAKAFGGGAAQTLAGPIGSGTYRALRKRGHGRGSSIAGGVAANLAVGAAAIAGGAALVKSQENKALDEKYGIKESAKRFSARTGMKESTARDYHREVAKVMETASKGKVVERIAALNDKYEYQKYVKK